MDDKRRKIHKICLEAITTQIIKQSNYWRLIDVRASTSGPRPPACGRAGGGLGGGAGPLLHPGPRPHPRLGSPGMQQGSLTQIWEIFKDILAGLVK